MLNLQRSLNRISISSSISKSLKQILSKDTRITSYRHEFPHFPISQRFLSTRGGGGGRRRDDDEGSWGKSWDSPKLSNPLNPTESEFGFDSVSSWSTGLTKEHFDGDAIGRQVNAEPSEIVPVRTSRAVRRVGAEEEEDEALLEFLEENKKSRKYVDSWDERLNELEALMKQVREPGARGSYLKDSEKAEMYKLHKENPEVYTVEKLANDYRIMRQRVHAILWLKEDEENEEKKHGPLDDSVEQLLDACPELFISHDREFHVASLPYKPDFKVMAEGWDGSTRDPDEVHYEISMKEEEMLYQEFVQRMNFNKKKIAGEVKCHKYSRRRPDEGWSLTVEKLGPRGKRGGGGGWKYVSLPDGCSRALNEMEKMYVKRETMRRRRKIAP